MRFLVLMIPAGYQPGGQDIPGAATGTPDPELVAAMMKFNQDLLDAGVLLALDGLHPPSAGARISFADGKPVLMDGPFTEAKEVIGGYWVLKVASRDEAVAWAMRCPAMKGDVLEVRQIQEMSDFPDEVVEAAREGGPRVIEQFSQSGQA
jgi:hypothetical protein